MEPIQKSSSMFTFVTLTQPHSQASRSLCQLGPGGRRMTRPFGYLYTERCQIARTMRLAAMCLHLKSIPYTMIAAHTGCFVQHTRSRAHLSKWGEGRAVATNRPAAACLSSSRDQSVSGGGEREWSQSWKAGMPLGPGRDNGRTNRALRHPRGKGCSTLSMCRAAQEKQRSLVKMG